MYGDPETVRALAREAEAHALAARDEAARVRAARAVTWHSTGADRFRDRLDDEAGRIERAAAELDDAAAALYRHAQACEETLQAIAAAERWFTSAVSSARDAVRAAADAASDVVEPAVLRLARSAPVPGSLAWLDFVRRVRP